MVRSTFTASHCRECESCALSTLMNNPGLKLERLNESRYRIECGSTSPDLGCIQHAFLIVFAIGAMGFGGITVATFLNLVWVDPPAAIASVLIFGFMSILAGLLTSSVWKERSIYAESRVIEIDNVAGLIRLQIGSRQWIEQQIQNVSAVVSYQYDHQGTFIAGLYLTFQCQPIGWNLLERRFGEYHRVQHLAEMDSVGQMIAEVLRTRFTSVKPKPPWRPDLI